MDKQTTQGLKKRQSELVRLGKRDSKEFRLVTELLHHKLEDQPTSEAKNTSGLITNTKLGWKCLGEIE